jgi:hypothetical protein
MAAFAEQAVKTNEKASDEIVSLEARQQQLLVLVGELLRTNEELRQKVVRLEEQGSAAS